MSGHDADDPYAVLGVSPDASASTIKSRYQALLLKIHPDRNGGQVGGDGDADAFHRLQLAWKAVGEERTRRKHDALARIGQEVNLWKTVSAKDMDHCDQRLLTYDCRCGGEFLLEEEELEDDDGPVVVECDTCSLSIAVIQDKIPA